MDESERGGRGGGKRAGGGGGEGGSGREGAGGKDGWERSGWLTGREEALRRGGRGRGRGREAVRTGGRVS